MSGTLCGRRVHLINAALGLVTVLVCGCVDSLRSLPPGDIRLGEYMSDIDGLKIVKRELTRATNLAASGREPEALSIFLLVRSRHGFSDATVDAEARRGADGILDPVRALVERAATVADTFPAVRVRTLGTICAAHSRVGEAERFNAALRDARTRLAAAHLAAAQAPRVTAGEALHHCFVARELGGECDVDGARARARQASAITWQVIPAASCALVSDAVTKQLGAAAGARTVRVRLDVAACAPTMKTWATDEHREYDTGRTERVYLGTETEHQVVTPATEVKHYTNYVNAQTGQGNVVMDSVTTIPEVTKDVRVDRYDTHKVMETDYFKINHVDYHLELSGTVTLSEGARTTTIPVKLERTHNDSEAPTTHTSAAKSLTETLEVAGASMANEIGEELKSAIVSATQTLLAPPIDQPGFVGAALEIGATLGDVAPATRSALVAGGEMSDADVTLALSGRSVADATPAPGADPPQAAYQPLEGWRPPPTEVVKRWTPNGKVVGTGIGLLLLGYLLDVAVTYGYGHEPATTSLIPVVGPWMQWNDQFANNVMFLGTKYTPDNIKGGLIITGILEDLGALLTIVGLPIFREEERLITFTPTLGGGRLTVSF